VKPIFYSGFPGDISHATYQFVQLLTFKSSRCFSTQHNLIRRVNYEFPVNFLPGFVPLCFLIHRWNKQYCNLFYREILQIAFDLYGIISRNEQLLMQEVGGGVFFLYYGIQMLQTY